MTVVSSKEFAINDDKYFDLAMNEQVFVKRDNIMFILTKANEHKKRYLEPDDDLRRAITMEEFRQKVKEDIHKIYTSH